jgi:hypothetical protein
MSAARAGGSLAGLHRWDGFSPGHENPGYWRRRRFDCNFDIGSAAIKRNLQGTIFWKQFLRKIAVNRSQWTILGFTDCQGGESRNTKLREDRAAAVFNILPPEIKPQIVSHEAAPIYNCITENNTAADRTLNRSVAFMLGDRAVKLKAEDVPPGFVCGPDITDELMSAVSGLKSKFDRLSSDEQEEVCGTLNSLLYGLWTWDIALLYHEITHGSPMTTVSMAVRPRGRLRRAARRFK